MSCAKQLPTLRIVLDTCILKLATLPNPANKAAFIWELCQRGKLQFFGSPDTLGEYHRVLAGHPAFLEEIQAAIELCYPFFTATAIEHEPDNRFLEVALAAQADYLIQSIPRTDILTGKIMKGCASSLRANFFGKAMCNRCWPTFNSGLCLACPAIP